jgi:predicted permease
MDSPHIAHDVRVAGRTLIRSRFISGLAIGAFALGIGVTTAVFSIFNGVLLAPLPYPDPDELVLVYDTQPACKTCPASYPKYIDWKTRNHVLSAMGGSTLQAFVMTGRREPLNVVGAKTTASLGDVFGVKPQIGRWFTEAEDQFGGPKVAVLSHPFWLAQFNGNPGILGSKVILDEEPYEIIGVMPPTFAHRRGDLFVPLQRKYDAATRGNHFLATYARLKRGTSLMQATKEMRDLGGILAREFNHNHGIDVVSYREAIIGDVRTPLRILLGAVFLVLLIACANVANLLLASGIARKRELSIRMALGAGRQRLVRQLTTESVLLASIGGALGVLVAFWLVRVFARLAGNQLPRADTVAIDGRVLLFAAVLSVTVGIFCGIWPLILLRSRELAILVREGDTRTSTGSGRRFGNALVVVEIAIAFALLAGSGLLIKNLVLLRSRDAGIRTDRIVAFDLSPSGQRYKEDAQIVALYRELYDRFSAMGGVESVGMTSHLPMYRFGSNGEFQIEGGLPWDPRNAPLVEYRWFSGEYFKTMGIPLLAGRMLDDRDGKGSTAVLINHAMAEKFWSGKDALGRRFGQGTDTTKWYQVVGIVGDIRSLGLAPAPPYEFYRKIEQSAFSALTVVIRTRGDDPTMIIPSARQIVASIDPLLPLGKVQTMETVVSDSLGRPRLLSSLTAVFGGLAGVLAMVGVYGVMGYNVRRQRREFGIRVALGADRATVRLLVLRRGVGLAALGVAFGAAGALFLTRVLQTFLNDVKPTDPSIFALTGLAVLTVAALASYLPARSAGRIDPIIVLRDS